MYNIKRKIKSFIKKTNKKIFEYKMYLVEMSKINDRRRKKIYSKIKYTKKEEQEIQSFFKENYGKKVDTRWHKLYQSFTGKFDKTYFPEILFSSKLEPFLCDRDISRQMTDKSMVELLYNGIDGLYIPKTTLICCSNIFYDNNRKIISREEAITILNNCGEKIIKKTIDSSSGRGVLIVNIKDGIDIKNNKSVDTLLLEFGENFIVQELISNSIEIRRIFDNSLNTFRIITYAINGKLYHVPIVMRIGRGKNEVDNIHAGGLFIGVKDNGLLLDKAFTEFQETFYKHPDSKIEFKNYKIDGIEKIINIAYKCHGRTPHIGMISWDFTIDDKKRIVLIEVNLNGQSIWFPQMAHGKGAFGDNTAYMLQLIRK